MSESPGLWSRIRNARIVQVLIVYLGVSWVLLQVIGDLRDALELPVWIGPVAFILLVVGLLMVLATAWVQAHPARPQREAADEVPRSWEVDVGEIRESLSRGRLPHLTWARALLGGAFVFALLFGAAGLYVVIQDRGESFTPPEAIASDDLAPGIAVLPFSVRGEDLDLWEEGMVDALSTNLDGVGGFRTIAAQTMLARWSEVAPDGQRPDLETALGAARATGARYAVTGSVLSTAGSLRLTTDVYDVSTGDVLGHGQVDGHADSVFSLVDRLSIEVLRALVNDADLDPSALGLSRVTSTSLPALKAYLEGEALFRRGDMEAAIPAYERAVEADSTFALASYRLDSAYGWTSSVRSAVTAQAADRALRYADRLPERQATLVRAAHSMSAGSPDGIPLLREALRRHPEDAEAWFLLGDLYYHEGPRLLVPLEETAAAFERAVELAPAFAPYRIHWVDMAGRHRPDSAMAAQRLAEFRMLAAGTAEERQRTAAFELMFGDSATRRRAVEETPASPEYYTAFSASGLRSPRFRAPAAAWLGKVYDEIPRDERAGFGAGVLAPVLADGLGRVEDAMALASDPAVQPGQTACYLYRMHAMGLPVPSERLDEVMAAAGDAANCVVFSRGARAAEDGRWAEQAAAIALLDLRAAEVLADTTRPLARREPGSRFVDGWARTLEGYGQWLRGDPEAAVATLDAARPYAPAIARWWLAQLYLELGREADAKRALESLFMDYSIVRYHLGKVSEGLGDLEDARWAYEDFVIAWEDADPELQPMVEEARQALARLLETPRDGDDTPDAASDAG